MKNTTVFSLVLLTSLALAGEVAGQSPMLNTTRDQFNANGMRIGNYATIWGMASSDKGEVTGQTYLDTTWTQGNLKLYEAVQPVGGKAVDTLSGIGMRYNVHYNEIEILLNTHRDTRAVPGDRITSFSLEKKDKKPLYFVNTKGYEADKAPAGFYEILVHGRLTLTAYHHTVVRKPNYNAAFEVGDKDTKIMQEIDFYALQEGKAEKLKLSRKALLEVMGDRSKEMDAFMKTNDLDLKNRQDLMRLFEAYNKK